MRVYIAGPITIGNPMVHTHNALKVSDACMDAGLAPFCPHLSIFWEVYSPRPAKVWYNYDLEWLDVCDALIRMPGESFGADNEVRYARKNNIYVVELSSLDNKDIVKAIKEIKNASKTI